MAQTLTRFILVTAALLALGGCTTTRHPPLVGGQAGAQLLGPGGQPLRSVAIGENVEVGASGLVPGRGYELDLTLDGRRVGFARAAADSRGEIAPSILWYQSGVIGCSGDWKIESARRPVAYRTFEEADRALSGRTLQLQVREAVPVDPRRNDRSEAFRPTRGRVVASRPLPATRSPAPQIYPSTAEGCLLNSAEARTRDMYVSGRGFTPGESVELAVAPNQVEWHVGDAVPAVSSGSGRVRVKAGADGRFTARVWEQSAQRQGAFDILARRLDLSEAQIDWSQIGPRDVVSFGHDTAYILFLYYPPGGTQMDVAGRTLNGSPYFQFADSFATTDDDVWGGVDPTYVQPGHPGGAYAAYHVVNHRAAAGAGSWANTTNLADLTGVIEIAQVKAGCINVTYREIWSAPLPIGNYDVVVNFGSVPAASQAAYVEDFNYDSGLDYLDGAIQIGFVVAPDPNALGPMAVGQTSYSVDDVLTLSAAVSSHHGPNQPNGPNVDLRAVVRYPATVAGVDTPVAPGTHPIFIMQHGNHGICNVAGSHTTCPPAQRKRNHEGYMRLLDVLASHGVIAVSVDAFDVTGIFDQWIPERADLNLAHLEFWSHLNNPATYVANAPWAAQTGMANRFNGSVDLTKVSVSGHSRGGEASVGTYVRNLMRPAAQQFGIGSVSSIAPVDGNAWVLGNVPYFVILPSADGDVASLSGARIYDRAGTATDLTIKSGIDVYGANHNFFNTVWAADGEEGGADSPRPYEMLAPDQQKIGESYIAAFVLSHLRGMSAYDDMLRGQLAFPSTAPGKIYHFRHETPFLKLDDGTSATPVAAGLTAAVQNGVSVHSTSVKRLTWNANSQTYTYALAPATDISGFEVLSFRAAQSNAAVNPVGTDMQFQLRLASGANTRFVYTGRFEFTPPPYDRPSAPSDQNVLTTVRVPLHSFIMNVVNPNPVVDLTLIDTVELKFFTPNQGQIYVDDVEFSR